MGFTVNLVSTIVDGYRRSEGLVTPPQSTANSIEHRRRHVAGTFSRLHPFRIGGSVFCRLQSCSVESVVSNDPWPNPSSTYQHCPRNRRWLCANIFDALASAENGQLPQKSIPPCSDLVVSEYDYYCPLMLNTREAFFSPYEPTHAMTAFLEYLDVQWPRTEILLEALYNLVAVQLFNRIVKESRVWLCDDSNALRTRAIVVERWYDAYWHF